jgi:hypothetical protein
MDGGKTKLKSVSLSNIRRRKEGRSEKKKFERTQKEILYCEYIIKKWANFVIFHMIFVSPSSRSDGEKVSFFLAIHVFV